MAIGDNFTVTKPDFGKNPLQFLKEVRTELMKVTWPSRTEIIRLTGVVIGVSIAVGIYLGSLDFIFTQLVQLLLK
jgi:preprotein translocase subunit SecE